MKRRKGVLRPIALSVAGIVLFIIGSYLYSRLRSSAVAIAVETVETPVVGIKPGGVLKIASYNIAHGRGGVFGASNWDGGTWAEKRRRLEDMGSLLADMGVDVVVLNEVDFAAVWSGHVDQAGLIAAAGAISILVDSGRFQHFPGAHELDRSATFPSEAPDRVIDWILFPPDWNLVEGFVRPSPLSDHLPVAAFVTRDWPHPLS